MREAWLSVARDAVAVLDNPHAGLQASESKENDHANFTGSATSRVSNEAARRASSIELLAHLIHLSEQESCQDPLFVGFDHEVCTLFRMGELREEHDVGPTRMQCEL